MPTPAERQALLFLAMVTALGVGARGCRAVRVPPPEPAAKAALAEQLARVDSVIALGGRRRGRPAPARDPEPGSSGPSSSGPLASSLSLPTPSTSGARPSHVGSPAPTTPSASEAPLLVDVDVAAAAELDRLPGIGPALARRIVEDRAQRGAFGSLEALQQVRGIGPALTARLRPHVTFSHPPRPLDTGVPGRRRARP